MRRQDVAESAGQARTACPARSGRNPDAAKAPAQRADGLARSAGAGPALAGPARSPAAGEMKLPCCPANETCSAPPAQQANNETCPSVACAAGKQRNLLGATCAAGKQPNPLSAACAAGKKRNPPFPLQPHRLDMPNLVRILLNCPVG